MLRSRPALPALQKTYDESYLTCSTAVYYESQGNEREATRCWKAALDQICGHHANKTNYLPRSETEKVLMDSLRQLEVQCKERIDILEALRLSRQEHLLPNNELSNGYFSKENSTSPTSPCGQDKGWIGNGTIPAITYPELSRPALPQRPPLLSRTSSEQSLPAGVKNANAPVRSGASESLNILMHTGSQPASQLRLSSRSPSPERHTMRTTLRIGRPGDKYSKSSDRRTVARPAEGSSKAATLAWNAISLRDKGSIRPDGQSSSVPGPVSSSRVPVSSSRPAAPSKTLWDVHSRRLVPARQTATTVVSEEKHSLDFAIRRPPDDVATEKQPSEWSISAATSALGAITFRELSEQTHSDGDRILGFRTASPSHRELLKPLENSSTTIARDAGGRKSSSYMPANAGHQHAGQAPTAGHGTEAVLLRARQGDRNRLNTGRRQAFKGKRHETTPSECAVSGSVDDPELVDETGPDNDMNADAKTATAWNKRKTAIIQKLPSGIDELAAKQILNEVVVRGDEVHWSDVAGLDVAKNALREAVVYPFLRPDLFKGLREPARGMLLFGPPGTGKTMLARAVATESRSTFFSISASSLTSKYLGESEKLVRALFSLAKVLSPSIIFVDEIDSLLSHRSRSGEHEATRRIKTEFLIQWSNLQRAAAGRDTGDEEGGDPDRVLVLAATNLPWAIDEAARRRFVRRQYIPLPEAQTRATQLMTLLSHQKHALSNDDIDRLVELTNGFSGSDITALAKDAAMGPLRSLGDALLHMTMDEIRAIRLDDFMASLTTIRPSVSQSGLQEYEDWAREFGERGG